MSRRTPRSTLFPYTTLFRSTGRDAADFYTIVSQLKMKRFRNPCHSMLGPAIATHLRDRKSTRLNSSHVAISYAVFCLKKKKQIQCQNLTIYKTTRVLR